MLQHRTPTLHSHAESPEHVPLNEKRWSTHATHPFAISSSWWFAEVVMML